MAVLKTVVQLSFLIALAASAAVENPFNVKFLTEDQLKAFLAEHPDAVKLEGKIANTASGGQELVVESYPIGNRQNGDYLVGVSSSDLYVYDGPQSSSIISSFPQDKRERAPVITFVDIQISQSPNAFVEFYVTDGGNGKRGITISGVIHDTYYFGFVIKFYGFY